MNSIAQIKIVEVDGPSGPANAMMVAVNIDDPQTAEAFVSQVAEEFKLHRMVAPPDTSLLLMTIIGGLSAERFAARWKAIEQEDEVVRAFMSRMLVADVIQGTSGGEQLSSVSLLDVHSTE